MNAITKPRASANVEDATRVKRKWQAGVLDADDMEALESMVSDYGLFSIVVALDLICGDRADEARHTDNDAKAARVWKSAETALNGLARRLEGASVDI